MDLLSLKTRTEVEPKVGIMREEVLAVSFPAKRPWAAHELALGPYEPKGANGGLSA
jgi:hypothetical protein